MVRFPFNVLRGSEWASHIRLSPPARLDCEIFMGGTNGLEVLEPVKLGCFTWNQRGAQRGAPSWLGFFNMAMDQYL